MISISSTRGTGKPIFDLTVVGVSVAITFSVRRYPQLLTIIKWTDVNLARYSARDCTEMLAIGQIYPVSP